MKNLAVIIPIYNEEKAIKKVLKDWTKILDELNIDYKIYAYNDGSKDNTEKILSEIAQKNTSIVAVNKKNSGHGSTILKGYKDNAKEYTWIFQTDSDNEIEAKNFLKLWNERKYFDFLTGKRTQRVQPISRKIVSLVSRLSVSLFYGKSVWDVNTPFRLMRSEKFISLFEQLPNEIFAPNVIISGYAAKKKLRCKEISVVHVQRQTGEVSIKKIKLLKASIKSFYQTLFYSFIVK